MTIKLKSCKSLLIIPALLLFLFIETTAQSNNHPFMVSLTGGASFPLGRFAEKNSTNWNTAPDKIGAAETGWSGNLQLGYRLNAHFGIALTAGISQYKRNWNAFKKYFEDIYGNSAEVSMKKWKVVKVLAGPTYTTAVSKKLIFQSGISAGISKTSVPAYNYAVYDSDGNTLAMGYNSKRKMPAAFAYQINAGFGYKLSQTFVLLLDMNYFDATARHKYLPYLPQPGSVEDFTELEEKYKLSAFSTTLGIGFRF